MKRFGLLLILSILVCLFLTGCAFPSSTPAPTPEPTPNWTEETGFEFELTSSSVILTKYVGESTEVVVPTEIAGLPVEGIGDSCFENSAVESIFIPKTVKVLGSDMAKGAEALTSLKFEDEKTVSSIGKSIITGTTLEHKLDNDSHIFAIGRTLVRVSPDYEGDLIIPDGVTRIAEGAFESAKVRSVSFNSAFEQIVPSELLPLDNLKYIIVNSSLALFDDEEMFVDKKQYIICHAETNAEAYSVKYGYCYNVIGESEEWQYSVEDGNVTIEKYKGSSQCVMIPDVIDNKPVTRLSDHVFEDKTVVYIYIPASVRYIEASFADGCTDLANVYFEDVMNIDFIGADAFRGTVFENETNRKNDVSIVGSTLTRCFAAEHAVVPSQAKIIAGHAFESTVKDITIEEGCVQFENGMLEGCDQLEYIYIPNTVKNVNPGAFTDRRDIVIRCDAVADAVSFAKKNGFECATVYYWKYTLNEEKHTVVLDEYIGNQENVTVPKTVNGYEVVKISSIRNSTIKKIYIPRSVTEIETMFAYGLEGLEEVVFEDAASLERIGAQAFAGTTFEILNQKDGLLIIGNILLSYTGEGMISVTDGVKSIADMAFSNSEVVIVKLPKSLESIGSWAFRGCKELNYVVIEDNVKSIGNNAFDGCNQVLIQCHSGTYAEQYVKKNGIPFGIIDYEDWNYEIIENGVRLTKYYGNEETVFIPSVISGMNVVSLGRECFAGSSAFTVIVPDTVKRLEELSFAGAWSLEKVIFENEDTIEYVGDNIFLNTPYFAIKETENGFFVINGYLIKCDAMGDVVIPPYVSEILSGAFANSIGVTSVTVDEACVRIGNSEFALMSDLEWIYIPDGTISIGSKLLGDESETVIRCHSRSQIKAYADQNGYTVEITDYDYNYTTSNGEVTLVKYVGNEKNISIPCYIAGYPVRTIESGCFADSEIEYVFINSGIRKIMSGAFPETLVRVEFGSDSELEYIAEGAFPKKFIEKNKDLSDKTVISGILLKGPSEGNVVLSGDIRAIAGGAFRGSNAKTITVSGNTAIYENAFSGMTNVDWISIGDKVTKIMPGILEGTETTIRCNAGSYAQQYAIDNGIRCQVMDAEKFLWEYTVTDKGVIINKYKGTGIEAAIPATLSGKTVIEIGEKCFEGSEVRGISIPSGVKRIGAEAFVNTKYLEALTFADVSKIEYIGPDAFAGSALPEAIRDKNGFAIINNILVSYKGDESCVLYNTIKAIAGYSFGSEVTSVTVNSSCMIINDYAFASASSLKSIFVPDSVTSIGENLFAGEVTIICHDGSEIKKYADAKGIKAETVKDDFTYSFDASGNATVTGYTGTDINVVIPMMTGLHKVTKLGTDCFKESGIVSVFIPETVTDIGAGCFAGSMYLEKVVFENENNISYIGNKAFRETYFEAASGVDENNAVIINGILIRHYGNGDIEVGADIVGIAGGAFFDRMDIDNIIINEGCTWIDKEAFSMLPSLTSILMPRSVLLIDDNAFWGLAAEAIIMCYSDTYAEQFAKANNIPCILLD